MPSSHNVCSSLWRSRAHRNENTMSAKQSPGLVPREVLHASCWMPTKKCVSVCRARRTFWSWGEIPARSTADASSKWAWRARDVSFHLRRIASYKQICASWTHFAKKSGAMWRAKQMVSTDSRVGQMHDLPAGVLSQTLYIASHCRQTHWRQHIGRIFIWMAFWLRVEIDRRELQFAFNYSDANSSVVCVGIENMPWLLAHEPCDQSNDFPINHYIIIWVDDSIFPMVPYYYRYESTTLSLLLQILNPSCNTLKINVSMAVSTFPNTTRGPFTLRLALV